MSFTGAESAGVKIVLVAKVVADGVVIFEQEFLTIDNPQDRWKKVDMECEEMRSRKGES